MSSPHRRRAAKPSLAWRNIRWAAIALLALCLAPSDASRDDAFVGGSTGDDSEGSAEIAAEPNPLEGWPWIAAESLSDCGP
jgi:hypothetical protein